MIHVAGAYRLSPHAQRRIRSRNLRTEHLLAALAQPGKPYNARRQRHVDKRSRCCVVVDEADRVIVTAYTQRRDPRRRG